mgnify:CR=1 FL=1
MSNKHIETEARRLDRFTLAPWNTVKTLSGKVYVVGANSEAIAEVTPKNANLVAAAPELLEALDNIIKTWDAPMYDDTDARLDLMFDVIEKHRPALAKARGDVDAP